MDASSSVSWSWSGFGTQGPASGFPATLTVALHTGTAWLTLWSAPLECGTAASNGAGSFPVPRSHSFDGWSRLLLHAPGRDSEVYAFSDVPSAMLLCRPSHPEATHVMVVGEGAAAATLRVKIVGVNAEPVATVTAPTRLPAPAAAPRAAEAAPPAPAPAAGRASPPPHHQQQHHNNTGSHTSAPLARGRTSPPPDAGPHAPLSHEAADALGATARERSARSAQMGDVDGLAARGSPSPPPRGPPAPAGAPATPPSPPPGALAVAEARVAKAEGDAAAANARAGALAAELRVLESRVAVLAAAAASAPPPGAVNADAVGRAAREHKLRLAMDERRALAESQLAALRVQLRVLETSKMADAAAAADARAAIAHADAAAARAARAEAAAAEERARAERAEATAAAADAARKAAEEAADAARRAAAEGCEAAEARAAAAAAAAPSEAPAPAPPRPADPPPATAPGGELFAMLSRLLAAVSTACAAAAPASPTCASIARSFSLPAEGSAGAGGARLLLAGEAAALLLPDLVTALVGAAGAAEDARAAGASAAADADAAHARALDERARLVRDWQKYAEHWESRGREAETLVVEWEAAYRAVVREKTEREEELVAVRAGRAGSGAPAGGAASATGGDGHPPFRPGAAGAAPTPPAPQPTAGALPGGTLLLGASPREMRA